MGLVKQPPSAAFPSTSAERRFRRPFGKPPASAAANKENKNGARGAAPGRAKVKNKWGTYGAPNGFKKLPQGYEDSECVLSFEIGQQERGFYNGRTDRQTKSPTTLF